MDELKDNDYRHIRSNSSIMNVKGEEGKPQGWGSGKGIGLSGSGREEP